MYKKKRTSMFQAHANARSLLNLRCKGEKLIESTWALSRRKLREKKEPKEKSALSKGSTLETKE